MKTKVVKLENDVIEFENGVKLFSEHDRDCCENHYLSMSDLNIADFEGLEFDLSNDDFFERIEGYGIALKPINGHPVRIPGYGYNNGYYSSNLDLVLDYPDGSQTNYHIDECQDISG